MLKGGLSLLCLFTLGVVIRFTLKKSIQHHKWQNKKPPDHIKLVGQYLHFRDCLHFDRHVSNLKLKMQNAK